MKYEPVNYAEVLLNELLDRYERSRVSRGENKVNVSISFEFRKDKIPEYHDYNSAIYLDIHRHMEILSRANLITIHWINEVPDYIIDKITLNLDHVTEAYQFVGRTPRSDIEQTALSKLMLKQDECTTPVAQKFTAWLIQRISNHQSVRTFGDIENGMADLLTKIDCVRWVEENTETCYDREFSILHYADSKAFEPLKSGIAKIFRFIDPSFDGAGTDAIFSEYQIYSTPSYVYLKGDAVIRQDSAYAVDLSGFQHGIGLSDDDLRRVSIEARNTTSKVITIENLTSFFRYTEANAIIIYLGGFHNSSRRKLIRKIYEQIPDAQYLHFGDIDAGGFLIFEDLVTKTGIPFHTYHMGIPELEQYEKYTKPLEKNDQKRILDMLNTPNPIRQEYSSVLTKMLNCNIKLEQECISYLLSKP